MIGSETPGNIPPNLLLPVPGYVLLELLYSSSKTLIYRALREADQHPVVIKVLRQEYPNFNDLVHFRNQYIITHGLSIPGILAADALEVIGHRYGLVMEDFGGISLKQYLALGPLSLEHFFAIAKQLATILADLYRHNIIHKDIKPANILIRPETHEIKLIDFSIASQLPKETWEIQSPNVLEGTLAYLSPEQTGRMNRGIDYRTDFYSLGVTFYEMLTGRLPFTAREPMELVHCHLAKQPVPPHKVLAAQIEFDDPPGRRGTMGCPIALSQIVMKLMAKNAEDRYQSAAGLYHDLDHCEAEWLQTGRITPFSLGQRDLSDRFLIPEKLYGREAEVRSLMEAFARVVTPPLRRGLRSRQAVENQEQDLAPVEGRSQRVASLAPPASMSTPQRELMLIAGYSGIGKTAVVNEVHKPIVRQRGYFIRGKFDQFHRNVPLSALVQAFRSLMGQLLSETDEDLARWRDRILDAVVGNGQILIDVIPELERIIGSQPPVPELSGTAAQNRFKLLFQQFIQVFTTADHPLVLFLDDLQWADLASLAVLKLLLQDADRGYLLVLGAYRDNEVDATHPLMQAIAEIREARVRVNTLTLAPLKPEDVTAWVADTLHCRPEMAQPLAELVYQKTGGNPFFATQFLRALHTDGWITFNARDRGWQCDIAQVKTQALTADIVAFMGGQLGKLPQPTQAMLQIAACIGNQFDLQTLAIAAETSQIEVALKLWPALQGGWVIPIRETYKFFQMPEGGDVPAVEGVMVPYRFLHDRVQQAAYAAIPDREKQATHLNIGRLLRHSTPDTDLDAHLFDIVNQLNLGRAGMTDAAEQLALAELNLQAGRKAIAATAYVAALEYLETGLSLLPAHAWDNHYDLTWALHTAAAEAAYLAIQFPRSMALAATAQAHAATLLDQVGIYELQMQIDIAQLQMGRAVDTGLAVLGQLGITLRSQVAADLQRICLPTLAALDDQPTMTDPNQLAAMRILKLLCTPVFQARPELFPQIIITMIQLCLDHGNSALSAFAYGFYGLLLVGIGDFNQGYHAGHIALHLLDAFDAKKLKATVYNLFNSNNRSWKEPAHNSVAPLAEGVQSGLETGELEWAGYCAANLCGYLFFTTDNLMIASERQQHYIQLCQKIQQDIPLRFSQVWHQTALNFQGKAANEAEFKMLAGRSFDEAAMVPDLQAGGAGTVLYVFHTAKALLAYHAGDRALALDHVAQSEPYAGAALGFLQVMVLNFYHSLALLLDAEMLPAEEREIALQQVEQNQAQMLNWAAHSPENNRHRYALVAAEQARVLGHTWQAAERYDEAIAAAEAHHNFAEAALANEVAARFYLAQGRDRVAQAYLQEAYQGYAQWGAKAKLEALEQRYPTALQPLLAMQRSRSALIAFPDLVTVSSSNSATEVLDLATVIRASQALSGELNSEALMLTLLQVVVENAGAERAVLMLQKDDRLFLVAQCANRLDCEIRSIPVEGSQQVPERLIRYVFRMAEAVVVDDMAQQAEFAADPYFAEHPPRSVLCLPLLRQGHTVGVLYLENNRVAGAFTRDRIQVLNVLCTQAAISFENAALYESLQATNQHLQSSLEALQETQNQLIQATEKLQHDAFHDALTGLPNRLWLVELLDHVLQIYRRNPQRGFAVLFIDLDRFKLINESLGHTIGDDLLRAVANRLQHCVRDSDAIARLGGDEFAVLLEELDRPETAIAIAQHIQIELARPFTVSGYEVFTEASIGIAFSDPRYQHGASLMRDADTALYHAKAQGRNRHAVFDPAMQQLVTRRLRLEGDLRRAIVAQEFELHYQPIVSLTTGTLRGVEALLRWHHPQRGWISPVEFIPVAEETGLIGPLGNWVFREACEQLQRWQTADPGLSIMMNINLSAMQLKQADLIDSFQAVLESLTVPRSRIKLEITESCILETFTAEARRLKQLQELGLRLCIDDFGTGYSSLSRLHEFPIDTLKIDLSFVQRMTDDSNETVRMIVTLAHSLGLEVVAEGIATPDALRRLRSLGCELGQGYWFSRPVPGPEVVPWFHTTFNNWEG
ncbi:MAG: EAL domain-containing protein [Leptolyngbyaceae cyanobacterium T60_A2020_046]|nr:EAL domain-containing protein [Leptolyngbyaceae cyanobacterium T60_A2020_046]